MLGGQEARPARHNRYPRVFFFKRKRAGARKDRKTKAAPGQKRAAFRMPVEFDVFYTLHGRDGRRYARANDLSSGGLRLSTDEDLINGSMLVLDFVLPGEFVEGLTIEKEVFKQTPFGLRPESVKTTPAPFDPMRVNATVLSTFYIPATKSLAHGVKFVDVDEVTQEELHRFIHLWQLHQIRLRAEALR